MEKITRLPWVCVGITLDFFAPIFNDRFLKKILHLKKFKISIKEQKKRFESWKKRRHDNQPSSKVDQVELDDYNEVSNYLQTFKLFDC